MTEQPVAAQLNYEAVAAPYPPCLRKRPREKQLYSRLRTIYNKYSHTWDVESKSAWFSVIKRASLASSTVVKVTSHIIARRLTLANVTWAHVVVLRAIFKNAIHSSGKTVRTILAKYPSANLDSYAFSESYRLPRTEPALLSASEESAAPIEMGQATCTQPVAGAAPESEAGDGKADETDAEKVGIEKIKTERPEMEQPKPEAPAQPDFSNDASHQAHEPQPPVSGPAIKADCSDDPGTLTSVPAKKRKRAPKSVPGAAATAKKANKADSKSVAYQARHEATAPAVPADHSDGSTDEPATRATLEEPDTKAVDEPPAKRAKSGAKRGRKPGTSTKTGDVKRPKFSDKIAKLDDDMRRIDARLATQDSRLTRLHRDNTELRSTLDGVRRWVTKAQKHGAPVPAEVWAQLLDETRERRAGMTNEVKKEDGEDPVGGQGLGFAVTGGT